MTSAGVLIIALVELTKPAVLLLGLACLMLGLIVGTVHGRQDDSVGSELERHLARCRRRGEDASVLVVRLSDGAPIRKDAAEVLRITDSAVVRRVEKRWELHALLDHDEVSRSVVEERLRAALADSFPVFGWAAFPADGLTLAVLFEHALGMTERAAQTSSPRRANSSAGAPST